MIELRLQGIEEQLEVVRANLPNILSDQRKRLIQKLNDLKEQFDADRLEQEMVSLLPTAAMSMKSSIDWKRISVKFVVY